MEMNAKTYMGQSVEDEVECGVGALMSGARTLVSVRKPLHRETLMASLERRGHLVISANSPDAIQSIVAAGIVDIFIADPWIAADLSDRLRRIHPHLGIIELSMDDPIATDQALECAACLSGAATIPTHSPRSQTACGQAGLPAKSCRAVLTSRECEVLDLIIAGCASKVIAHSLGISQRTVEFHRAHIMRKTQTRNVAELVRLSLSAEPDRPPSSGTKRIAAKGAVQPDR